MKALVYTGTQQSEIRNEPQPIANEEEAIVDLSYCGICGSDMHAWHGHDARRVPPLILGHEAVGIVRDGAMKGKRVALNPLMTCGECDYCNSNFEHLCQFRELIGMRVPGGFAEAVAIKEKNLVLLPDTLDFKHAALVEPLAVAVHSVRIGLKQTVLPSQQLKVIIYGGGAIGLLCAMVLLNEGIKNVAIVEANPTRRDLLKTTITSNIYDPFNSEFEKVDLIFDAVGSGITRSEASKLTKPGGTIIHIGLQDNLEGLDTRHLTLQEIRFIGTYCYQTTDFSKAIELLQHNKISYGEWIDIRPIESGPQSFIDIHQGNAAPKIVLKI